MHLFKVSANISKVSASSRPPTAQSSDATKVVIRRIPVVTGKRSDRTMTTVSPRVDDGDESSSTGAVEPVGQERTVVRSYRNDARNVEGKKPRSDSNMLFRQYKNADGNWQDSDDNTPANMTLITPVLMRY